MMEEASMTRLGPAGRLQRENVECVFDFTAAGCRRSTAVYFALQHSLAARIHLILEQLRQGARVLREPTYQSKVAQLSVLQNG